MVWALRQLRKDTLEPELAGMPKERGAVANNVFRVVHRAVIGQCRQDRLRCSLALDQRCLTEIVAIQVEKRSPSLSSLSERSAALSSALSPCCLISSAAAR